MRLLYIGLYRVSIAQHDTLANSQEARNDIKDIYFYIAFELLVPGIAAFLDSRNGSVIWHIQFQIKIPSA